ncbi:unnamed protein product [Dracunculus medinensis]|uniref:Cadherin domain-containing protein n=1 Tax=Dracunculus medinensis TaxID=318479 RepID=A0A0N4UKR1_DRAME|nr:unnamed protein product [Dracunculus medinensis]
MAQNVMVPQMISTRLLRIFINDLDDNLPVFQKANESIPRVFVIDHDESDSGKVFVGQIRAFDRDATPFNHIYYYLIPSCSNENGKFAIDKFSGVISVNDVASLTKKEHWLCALATSYNVNDVFNIEFDRRNISMISLVVEIRSRNKSAYYPDYRFINNSIIIFGYEENSVPLSFGSFSSNNSVKYHLDSIREFSSESAPLSTIPASFHFAVDRNTGDVRIDPSLFDGQEGIYLLKIAIYHENTPFNSSQNYLFTKIHNVKKSSMLNFIFNQEADILGLNIGDFQQQLMNTLEMDPNSANITFFFSSPRLYASSSKNRSSVCFHSVRNDEILSQESIISILSSTLNNESMLSRLYQAFKVTNIESCSMEVESAQADFSSSRTSLLWSGFSLIGTLCLISFCAYSCFVMRYKTYLNEKAANVFGTKTRFDGKLALGNRGHIQFNAENF